MRAGHEEVDTAVTFLPTRIEQGEPSFDIILVSGDAYIDHPAFGTAIIGRWLQAHGYRVGIIAQPDWHNPASFTRLGQPRLFFGVSAGNIDSIVAHYTPTGKPRSDDAYTPGGSSGARPDRATIVYSQMLRAAYPGTPIILGGIEASLRRLPHYDFMQQKVRNSVLFDSRADAIVYGMGERAILEVAQRLREGLPLDDIPGLVCAVSTPHEEQPVLLPTPEECRADLRALHLVLEQHHRSRTLYMPFAGRWLRHNPPAAPLGTDEMDAVYALPFQRAPHPDYAGQPIPAFQQIRDSITSHRGCFGGCRFCALGYHQGKAIQSRSEASILAEVAQLAAGTGFRGTISDIGGPTANMYGMRCRQGIAATCPRASCLQPDICPHLDTSHRAVRHLLRQAAAHPAVRHLFVASGIRFDLALREPGYIDDIATNYTGGHLKLAPEHTVPRVLAAMGKPGSERYEQFCQRFEQASQRAGKQQYVLPYIMIGHPGETLHETVELALWLRQRGIRVRQVQQFTPTPMSLSTCMYATGRDFATGKPLHVPRGRELTLMKALVQWFLPQNHARVREALKLAGRPELTGRLLGKGTPPRKSGR